MRDGGLQRLAGLIVILLCFVTARSQSVRVPVTVDVPDSIAAALADHALTPIEGVWSVTDGAVFAIYTTGRGADGTEYAVTLLSSPDLRLPTGKKVGVARRVDGRGNRYALELSTDIDRKGRLGKTGKYKVLTGHSTDGGSRIEDGFITIEPERSRLRISPWIYFRFFVTVRASDSEVPNQIRARRIFPEPAISPDYPIVL